MLSLFEDGSITLGADLVSSKELFSDAGSDFSTESTDFGLVKDNIMVGY